MIPVALRDRLYKLFADCLGQGGAPAFEPRARALAKSAAERRYLDDRLPRYLSTLAGASASPPKDRLARELGVAELLFNHGLFFDAHEYLESVWKREGEPAKTFVQGLIQISAAFHKLELDPDGIAGAHYLLARGLEKLPADAAIAAALRPALAELQRGVRPGETPALEFHPPRGG